MENLDERYKKICLKLWGEEQGTEIHEWIITNRPVAFQRKLMEVMVPIWEMDKVDIRTKILCCVAAFTALGRGEVEFFLKWHMSIKYLKKRLKKSFCLRGLSQAFQMLKWQLRFWRGYTPDNVRHAT